MSEASHAVPAVQMYDPRTVTVPAEAFKKLSGKYQHHLQVGWHKCTT